MADTGIMGSLHTLAGIVHIITTHLCAKLECFYELTKVASQ